MPYNQGMTKAQLIQKAGAIKHLAVLLGISKAAISQWKDVPEQRIWQLKVMRPEWFLWAPLTGVTAQALTALNCNKRKTAELFLLPKLKNVVLHGNNASLSCVWTASLLATTRQNLGWPKQKFNLTCFFWFIVANETRLVGINYPNESVPASPPVFFKAAFLRRGNALLPF